MRGKTSRNVADGFGIGLREYVLHGDVEGNDRQRPVRAEDPCGGLGVVVDVRLGDGGDVAGSIERAAHDDNVADSRHRARFAGREVREVRRGPSASTRSRPVHSSERSRIRSTAEVRTTAEPSGCSPMSPTPSVPCTCGAPPRKVPTSGSAAPSATGMSVRPASSSSARVLSAARPAETLPETVPMPTTSTAGSARTYASARASSMPVSQST